MLKFYYSAAPNPTKVALFLEESELPYQAIPIESRKVDQHKPARLLAKPPNDCPAISNRSD
jgi:GSH-dependent disulfide-bond oxidoreductase